MLLPYLHSLHFPAEHGWPRAEQRPRSSWKEVDGTAPREGALGPRREGTEPSPNSSPLSSQHRKHLYSNSSIWRYTQSWVQRGRRMRGAGAVKTTAGSVGEDGKNILLSMGGDDGATDIAVGGHGIQLPPGKPTMTGRKDKREHPPPSPELLKQNYDCPKAQPPTATSSV